MLTSMFAPDDKANDRNEIFGPVLSIVAAETMDEAIEIINANK